MIADVARSFSNGSNLSHLVQTRSLPSAMFVPPASVTTKTTPFWIDTLCVSLDTKSPKTEEPLIWKVFRCTRVVLALNPALSEHLISLQRKPWCVYGTHYGSGDFGLWKRAFFVTQLIFSFRNKTVSLDQLLKGVHFTFPLSTGLRKHDMPRRFVR